MSPSWRQRRWLRRAAAASVAAVLLGIPWAVYFRPDAERVSSSVSDRSAPEAAVAAELAAMEQADGRWRRQLDELYEQTEPRAAASVGRPESEFSDALGELLGQLQQLETAAERTAPASLDPPSSFASAMQTTFQLFDQLTSTSPFTAP